MKLWKVAVLTIVMAIVGFGLIRQAPAAGNAKPDPKAAALLDPIYMQYEGIKGDVTTRGHEGWIELSSFQWGVGRAVGAPALSNRPGAHEIVVTANLGSESNPLFQTCLSGAPIKTVTLDGLRTPNGPQYMKVTMHDCMVTHYSVGMSAGSDRPMESVSLNFAKVEFKYEPQSPTGR